MNVRIRSSSVLLALLRFLFVATLTHSLCQLAQGQPTEESASFKNVKETVSRLLLEPVYTSADERLLNQAGDSATTVPASSWPRIWGGSALAITGIVSDQEMNSPETGRRVLLILHLAFEAPQSIMGRNNKMPNVALRLLDQLEQTDYGRQPNVIGNARFEIKHNMSTGQPLQPVTLPGEPVIDWGHTQWLSNMLLLITTIKPGMARSDLLRVFRTEGGLSTRTRRTFVLKQCPTIKVDVEFSVSTNEGDDKITQISKPYLDYGHYD
jgi:hypothetical protein